MTETRWILGLSAFKGLQTVFTPLGTEAGIVFRYDDVPVHFMDAKCNMISELFLDIVVTHAWFADVSRLGLPTTQMFSAGRKKRIRRVIRRWCNGGWCYEG